MRLTVDPRFNITYYSFILEGFRRVLGAGMTIGDVGIDTNASNGFACIVEAGGTSLRCFFSTGDHASIDDVAFAWADVYGVVNYDPAWRTNPAYAKVVPIGPVFAIRSWGSTTSLDMVRLSAGRVRQPQQALEAAVGVFKLLRHRLEEQRYTPVSSERGYVFFAAWAWKKHLELNAPRARFVRACKAVPQLKFEGGFAPRRRQDVGGLDDVTAPRKYPFRVYLQRLQRSAVAFNCPAVHHCLGWKLGEFFALGKAIISLPLGREMPAPLQHGRHIHFVEDNEAAMVAAVKRIAFDDAYRNHLEINARAYYLRHLAPERVVMNVCGRLLEGDAHARA